ncbi:hypothetical protein Ssi02_21890 [Sinosporangium siamense]|uniref:Uncharacterized protein n=1 Tax=Sinosporangium siamense TaxID=1367973 RepID=A0A919RE51_9ACTN|nr:hypothetical protein Ssi02_21890 [Sinosporangium siamense]
MRPERLRAESLHGPWPTPIEELGAEFGDTWEIWREVDPAGRHGDWFARRLDGLGETLSASDADSLRDHISQANRRAVRQTLEDTQKPYAEMVLPETDTKQQA